MTQSSSAAVLETAKFRNHYGSFQHNEKGAHHELFTLSGIDGTRVYRGFACLSDRRQSLALCLLRPSCRSGHCIQQAAISSGCPTLETEQTPSGSRGSLNGTAERRGEVPWREYVRGSFRLREAELLDAGHQGCGLYSELFSGTTRTVNSPMTAFQSSH